MCERVDPSALNKRTVESLIKAGAFDSLGHLRQGLFLVFEEIVDVILARRRERDAGIMSLFGDAASGNDDVAASFDRPPIPDQEFSKSQRLAFEKEMLGLYVSDHPLMGAERALRRYADTTLTELKEMREGEMRTVGGVVTALARKYTKRGDLMATFVLEDLGGAVEVMVFPKTMATFGELLDRRRDRVREGPHRHARGRAEAHRDGDHAAAARASTAASRCASRPGPAC